MFILNTHSTIKKMTHKELKDFLFEIIEELYLLKKTVITQ